MEEAKDGDRPSPEEALGRPGRRIPSPVITLIASILELDWHRADMLAEAWADALYRLDRGDATQARPDGDVAGRTALGGREEVVDIHAYRAALDPMCIIGHCSLNNCLYPYCIAKPTPEMTPWAS